MIKIFQFCKRITSFSLFEHFILGVIIFNGIIIGLETSPTLYTKYEAIFHMLNAFILFIFIVEALIKIVAEGPHFQKYFRGWNLFDFTIIVLSFLPSGQFATLARLVRVLRLARILSLVPELRLIIATLLRSLPSIGHIVLLLGILFYIYGVIGYYLFHKIDPANWGNLGMCLLTLFGIVTLEGWVEKMSLVLPTMPLAWIYFLSFIVTGTFTFINLFVAVVINNLSEAKEERLKEIQKVPNREELLKELQVTKDALGRLQMQLQKSTDREAMSR